MTMSLLQEGMPRCECGGVILILHEVIPRREWTAQCSRCKVMMRITQLFDENGNELKLPINNEDH